jgi:hypothetical protein
MKRRAAKLNEMGPGHSFKGELRKANGEWKGKRRANAFLELILRFFVFFILFLRKTLTKGRKTKTEGRWMSRKVGDSDINVG